MHQQGAGGFGALLPFMRIAEDGVVARELNQHEALLIAQLGRRAAKARHVVEQAFGLGQQGKRRLARHAVGFRLGYRHIHDIGGALQRCGQKRLVGLELLPGIDRAAGRSYGEDGEGGDDAIAHATLAAPLALGAAEDIVRGKSEQSGDDLGERKRSAVALIARVGRQQFDLSLGDAAFAVELEFERWRKAFEFGIAGLAGDDQRDDRAVGMA